MNTEEDALRELLDRQVSAQVPDIDVLMNEGRRYGGAPDAHALDTVADWFSQRKTEAAADVVSCFLIGYWAAPDEPSSRLAGLVLDFLESSEASQLSGATLNSAVLALRNGLMKGFSTENESRTRAWLESLSKNRGSLPLQSGARKALEEILGEA